MNLHLGEACARLSRGESCRTTPLSDLHQKLKRCRPNKIWTACAGFWDEQFNTNAVWVLKEGTAFGGCVDLTLNMTT